MKINALILLGLTTALASGCGVKNETVENRPPIVHRDLVSFDKAYGKFDLTVASAFLWPEGLSEDGIADLVMQLNGTSMKLDPLFAKQGDLFVESKQLDFQWKNLNCVGYAVPAPGEDPEIDGVTHWKVPDASDQKSVSEIQMCMANQDRRAKLPNERGDINQQLGPLLEAINRALDPDKNHIVNSKTLDASVSSLVFEKKDDGDVRVHITLGHFLFPSYSPSTDVVNAATGSAQITNATYDDRNRVLKFDVPETDGTKNADGSLHLTGLTYLFRLERGPNIGPIASFKGDMNLCDANGYIIRHGTGRIDAFPPK